MSARRLRASLAAAALAGASFAVPQKRLKDTPWKPYALRLLREAKFFEDLTAQQRAEAAELMVLQAVEPSETIFHQGDPGDKFFIIADGSVKAYVETEDGEEMVKHYKTGEYFGELALLTRAPRRATCRNGKEGQTLLLYLAREDFDQTCGSMRELILRSAAFRPAQRAQEQQQRLAEASKVEQILGLSGGVRRFLLTVLLYLLVGTAFYSYTGFEEVPGSPIVAFYFSVETALAVGFGVLTPRGASAPFFTAAFVISGAAIVVNFLSGVVADFLEDAEKRRVEKSPVMAFAVPLLLWWLLGVAFGRLHEGWPWGQAVLFAISATSSVGIQGLDSTDDFSLLFCALYLLAGVPLYASVIARISLLIGQDTVKRRQQEFRSRATAALDGCDDECKLDIFSMYDTDQDGRISKKDIPELLRFLSAARGLVVTDADIQFLIAEWDEDKTETITKSEFLAGLKQWQAVIEGQP